MNDAHREGSTAARPERIVFGGKRAGVGEWRCDLAWPTFGDTGPTIRYLVAFPRTSVRIRHEGSRSFVTDASIFTMYNAGQRYTREPVHPAGDLCDWWSVDLETAQAIARAVDPSAAHDSDRPFRFENGPADAGLYMRQRTTLHRIKAGLVDALEAEELAMRIVERALRNAAGAVHQARSRGNRAQRDLAEAALALIAARFRERLTLDDIACALGVSAFHLCRVFRRETGALLHRHVLRLRVRSCLEAVARDDDLSAVALDAGFCSHSHFTAAFVREFGMPPSAWRCRAGRQRESLRRV